MVRLKKMQMEGDGKELKSLRKTLQMNQGEFWSRLGITQSGGSRYESGRQMPKPAMLLMQIAYGTERQAASLVEQLRARA